MKEIAIGAATLIAFGAINHWIKRATDGARDLPDLMMNIALLVGVFGVGMIALATVCFCVGCAVRGVFP